MGTTPTLALPYPEPADPADVPTDIHELATALDTLVHKVTYGTTPPASPADGDEWILPADATNGVMWRFRYRAASASAYKWEFIGGPPLYGENPTVGAGTVGSWAPVQPSLAPARAGDYLASFSLSSATTSGAGTLAGCLWPSGGRLAATETIVSNVNGEQALGRTDILLTGQPAAGAIVLGQYCSVAANFSKRWLSLLPVRVS
jgi:hypothetical protein